MSASILKQHADYLRLFWATHGERRRVSRADWEETIAALQRAGEFHIIYKDPKNTLEKRRKAFDKVKDKRKRYSFQPGDKCFACGKNPNVRHHIIWLKHGGRNNRRNICFLCHPCHAAVHPWLEK